jgi:hypothetical protein
MVCPLVRGDDQMLTLHHVTDGVNDTTWRA